MKLVRLSRRGSSPELTRISTPFRVRSSTPRFLKTLYAFIFLSFLIYSSPLVPTFSPVYFPPITRRPSGFPSRHSPTDQPERLQPMSLFPKNTTTHMPPSLSLDTSSTTTPYVSIDVQYFIMSLLGFYVLVLSVIVLRCAFFYVTDPSDMESLVKKETPFYIDVDLNDIQRKPRSRGFSFRNRVIPLLPLHIEEKPPLRVYSPPRVYRPRVPDIPYNPNSYNPFLEERKKLVDISGLRLSWLDDQAFLRKNHIHPEKPSLISKLFPSISSKSYFSSSQEDSYKQSDKQSSRSLSENLSIKTSSQRSRTSSMMDRFQYFTNPRSHTLLSLPKKTSIIRPLYEEFSPVIPP